MQSYRKKSSDHKNNNILIFYQMIFEKYEIIVRIDSKRSENVL